MNRLVGLAVLALVLLAGASAQDGRWVTVYYPLWSMRPLGSVPEAIPPWEIDWSGITHVVHFMDGNVTKEPPYSSIVAGSRDSIDLEFCGYRNPGGGPGTWIHWQDSLIASAHRRDVKVLLTLQAVDPANLNFVAADSVRTETLVRYIVGYAARKGYDGIELDWEGAIAPPEHVNRLVRRLRAALDTMKPRGLLLIAAITAHDKVYWPSQDGLVDQYNIMCYDYVYAWHPAVRSNASWYVAPLHQGTIPPGFEGKSLDTRGPLQWVRSGHDRAKIGPGLPVFGWVLKGVDRLFEPMKSGGDYGYARYQQCVSLLNNGGTESWDDTRKVPSIAGSALRDEGATWWGQPGVKRGQKFFATYEDPRSIREKVAWLKANGFGGMMIYDLTMDFDPAKPFGQRNPVGSAAIEEFWKTTK